MFFLCGLQLAYTTESDDDPIPLPPSPTPNCALFGLAPLTLTRPLGRQLRRDQDGRGAARSGSV